MRSRVVERRRTIRGRKAERGVALIAVLWAAVLLSVLATALLALSRSEAHRLDGEIARLKAGEAAEAGIDLAVIALSAPNGEGWAVDGTPRTLSFEGVDIEVSAWSESGKIDLNTADRGLIRGLLVVEGLGPGAADALTDEILDRRGPASLHHLNSQAIASNSGGAGMPAFESIGEFAQLPGMTRDLYDRLAPYVTVYSGAPNVDISVAARDVILAIPGKTAADAEMAMKVRSSPALGGIVSAAGNDLSRIGQAFTIRAVAKLPDGTLGRRTKIVRLTGSPWEPDWILAVE